MIKLELCTDNLKGVKAAGEFGLNRVELCSALEIGGLTPNLGLVKACVEADCVEIHAMLRPRGGGFVYNSEELNIMSTNLKSFAEVGVHGVVFGVLNEDNTISEANKQLVELAQSYNIEATFHRAFDVIEDKEKAIKELIEFGFTRVLTSGGALNAIDGLEMISKLHKNYGSEIQILVGSGVNSENAGIFKNEGIEQLHFTARKARKSDDAFDFGLEYEVDINKIKAIKQSLL